MAKKIDEILQPSEKKNIYIVNVKLGVEILFFKFKTAVI